MREICQAEPGLRLVWWQSNAPEALVGERHGETNFLYKPLCHKGLLFAAVINRATETLPRILTLTSVRQIVYLLVIMLRSSASREVLGKSVSPLRVIPPAVYAGVSAPACKFNPKDLRRLPSAMSPSQHSGTTLRQSPIKTSLPTRKSSLLCHPSKQKTLKLPNEAVMLLKTKARILEKWPKPLCR